MSRRKHSPNMTKGKRVVSKQTGEAGTVVKTLNSCLWVLLDDGFTTMSGAKRFWRPEKMRRS